MVLHCRPELSRPVWPRRRRDAETGWLVRSFDVDLVVHPDAVLDVTETIDADFEVPKHGIYREIPIRYAVGLHQYALRFRLLGVDDGERHAVWNQC